MYKNVFANFAGLMQDNRLLFNHFPKYINSETIFSKTKKKEKKMIQ